MTVPDYAAAPSKGSPWGPTPGGWDENVAPTAEQLADWLGRATEAERVGFARHHREIVQHSNACHMQDHEGQAVELINLRQQLFELRQEHAELVAAVRQAMADAST